MAISKPKVTLSPVLPSEFPVIARLEATAFWDDDYSTVAFGPLHARTSDEVLAARAKSLAAPPRPGMRQRGVKAVVVGPEGEEQIVGFASWGFVVGRAGAEEEKALEEKAQEDEKRSFAPGANVRLFEDSILKGDEHMGRATEGRDYAKLWNLVVATEYQRRGIGSMLLEDGLREVDALGLQAVLGASPEGLGLYKKYGFVDYEVMDFNLWEYEGGERMGVARHVIMHRPAVSALG